MPNPTPTHPAGEIKIYTDALNRAQTSVDGPRGHVLVTGGRGGAYGPTFDVWHSNSIRTIISGADFRRAIKTACVAAGLDPRELVWPTR